MELDNLSNSINYLDKNIDAILNSNKKCKNIDTTITPASYDVGPDTEGNVPRSGYGLLVVRAACSTWVYQDLYYTFEDNIHHYQRKKINDNSWTEWDKYTSDKDMDKIFNTYLSEVKNIDSNVNGGIYTVNAATQGNLPYSGYGLLFVKRIYDWIYQDLYYTFEDNLYHYHRKKINEGTWTKWSKYISNKDLDSVWKLHDSTYIAPNTNLDDIRTVGSYHNHNNNESCTIINNPVSLAFTMQVYGSNGDPNWYITQEFRSYNSNGGIYIRKYDYYSKKWSSWIKLIQDNDITRCEIDLGTISLTNGVTVKSYDFKAMYSTNYILIGTPTPMVFYTDSHAYAQITFTSYYDYSGDLRIYCDRSIKARIVLRCLAIRRKN